MRSAAGVPPAAWSPPVKGMRIPFNQASLVGNEIEYIKMALEDRHISGAGSFTRKCEMLLEKSMGAPRIMLTTSGTHALELMALLLGIEEGDEVIVPSFTFTSTANAFVLRGARPVFIDIRPDTLCMDEGLLPGLITARTRAIVPVHYAGVACEMDEILAAASVGGIPVVEDNAHGLLGSYRGRMLGTFGPVSILSFHETKNVTCGEGGALVINDPSLVDRAEILCEKGTDRSKFFQGRVDKYTWVDVGSSYRPSEILAAFLFAQLEQLERIQEARRRIWEKYRDSLAGWARESGASLPVVPEHSTQAWHLFYILMATPDERRRMLEHLADRGILAVFHYQPLHLSRMGSSFGRASCPVTEDIAQRLIRLPLFTGLTPDDQEYVIDSVVEFGRSR
jgi:dTDP-4-amino-4,6-dideoxygalactose transaminase